MWEVGILLIGVGFLFFSVFLGLLLNNVSTTVKEITRILDRNSRDIEDIIISVAGLTTSANSLATGLSNITKRSMFTSAAKGAMSVAQARRNRKSRRA